MNEEAASLRQQLLTPRPPWILIVSSSPATISFASSILQGCVIVDVGSVEAAQVALASSGVFSPRFVLLDFQADDDLQKIRSMTQRLPNPPKIVHLFVPTLETIKNALVDSSKRDVFRSNHPIRRSANLPTVFHIDGRAELILLFLLLSFSAVDDGSFSFSSTSSLEVLERTRRTAVSLLRHQLRFGRLIVSPTTRRRSSAQPRSSSQKVSLSSRSFLCPSRSVERVVGR